MMALLVRLSVAGLQNELQLAKMLPVLLASYQEQVRPCEGDNNAARGSGHEHQSNWDTVDFLV